MGNLNCLFRADDFYDYSVAEVVSSFCVVLLIASEGKKRRKFFMLTSLSLIFLVGLAMGAICGYLKLPRIIGMLVTGIVLGPYVLDLLDPSILSISADLRKMALIIILLKAGLSLNLEDLKKVGRPAVMMSFVPASFEILGYILCAPAILGISRVDAAVMGAVLGAVSPAVVVPRMVKLIETKYGTGKAIPQMILAGASCDDIFVIVLFTTFLGMAQGDKADVKSFLNIPVSIVLGVALGAVVGYLLYLFFETAYAKKHYVRNSMKVIIVLGVSFLLIATPPLLLAALGSCFSERCGVVNIGIEGMMTIGAFTGAVMGLTTGNGWIAFLCAGLAGALFGLIHAFVCISCHADQTIAGTAINFLGPGLALFLCKAMYNNSSDTPAMDPSCKLPKLFEGVFPTGSFWNNVLNVYAVAYLVFILAFVCWFVFYKTKFGAHLRAVGEHPEACESLGIDVYKVRYTCVILSGFFAGLGGAFVTLATINQFRPSVIVGQGFIAIAAVIFGKFSPEGATKACLLFGLCSGIKSLAAQSNVVSPNLISMIPYVVTIIALVLFVGKAHTPAANGKIFVKSK